MEYECHRYSLDRIMRHLWALWNQITAEGLGISHSVTHRCSSETAHAHKIWSARKKREKVTDGGMGRGAGSRLQWQSIDSKGAQRKSAGIRRNWKVEIQTYNKKRKVKNRTTIKKGLKMFQHADKTSFSVKTEAPPGDRNALQTLWFIIQSRWKCLQLQLSQTEIIFPSWAALLFCGLCPRSGPVSNHLLHQLQLWQCEATR